MEILKISNNHGYYILNSIDNLISDINKDDLLCLLKLIYENDNIEMDESNNDNQILNDAEKIIYENIYKYFNDFLENKESIKNEIKNEFKEIVEFINTDEAKN